MPGTWRERRKKRRSAGCASWQPLLSPYFCERKAGYPGVIETGWLFLFRFEGIIQHSIAIEREKRLESLPSEHGGKPVPVVLPHEIVGNLLYGRPKRLCLRRFRRSARERRSQRISGMVLQVKEKCNTPISRASVTLIRSSSRTSLRTH